MRIITPSFIGIAGFVFVACESPKPGGNGKVTPPTTTHCPARPAAKSFPGFSAGEIIRIDVAAMDGLIAPGARIEKLAGPGSRYGSLTGTSHSLAEGFKWSEGPVWVEHGRYLLFSDIPPNRVYKWSEHEGLSLFLKKSGYTGDQPRLGKTVNGVTDEPGSNGLLIDPEGRLVLCQHGNRMVARLGISLRNPKPIYEVLAERHDGKRLNSPNDVVVHSSGAVYFTDPPYGIEPEEMEQAHAGVYRVDPGGEIELLVDDFEKPNGLAFSPDESVLYIDDSHHQHIRAFDVAADGSLQNGRPFADLAHDSDGVPDGMKVDLEGNVYATNSLGIWVHSARGEFLGLISVPEVPANCAWGEDGQVLFIAARTSVYRIRMRVPGVAVLGPSFGIQ